MLCLWVAVSKARDEARDVVSRVADNAVVDRATVNDVRGQSSGVLRIRTTRAQRVFQLEKQRGCTSDLRSKQHSAALDKLGNQSIVHGCHGDDAVLSSACRGASATDSAQQQGPLQSPRTHISGPCQRSWTRGWTRRRAAGLLSRRQCMGSCQRLRRSKGALSRAPP